MPRMSEPTGFFLVDKPLGWTSFDCVQCIKRRYRLKKVGHAGTLDPIASGLLIILVGGATRWFDQMQIGCKEYRTTLLLGASFDTQDITGKLLDLASPHELPDFACVQDTLNEFLGQSEQCPPVYSAIKIGGKPAYHYARKGNPIAPKKRLINIESIELENYTFPHIHFKVRSGKGMYVRTLCSDIAGRLGVPGSLAALERTRQGDYTLAEAQGLEALPDDIRCHLRQL